MTKDASDIPYSEPDYTPTQDEIELAATASISIKQMRLRNSLVYLKDVCGNISREHGFWINKDNPDKLLMLMVGELSEAHEDLRNGHEPQHVYYEKKPDGSLKPCGFGVELADCVIRIFDACAQLDIDLPAAIMEKIEYNKSRPYLHGRNF